MKRFLLPLLAVLLCCPLTLAQNEAQKREMRTVWIATVSNIDWPQTRGTSASVIAKQKKQLTDLLDGFVASNMNAVCLQVRPMADALYRSSYEPWSSYVSGTRGVDPGWDPMEFAVEECHKRGLEFHAWVNPYRFSNSSGNDCNTAIDQALKQSGILMQVGSKIVFNPALQESRDHLMKVCREMIMNYDIDGIIFDDYFYPGDGTPTDASAPDYQLWANANSGMSIADWRRNNVRIMVRQFYNMVQEARPGVKFSIGPAGVAGTRSTSASLYGVDPCPTGSDWQYNQIYSDPLAWLYDGTIDFISPQLYWKTNHSTNPFGPLTQWWSYIAHHFGRHHYASHNIYFMASTNTQEDWDEILQQIQYSRDYNLDNAPGVNFYSAKYINGPTCTGFGAYLAEHMFQHKALTPALTWKDRVVYDAPANLTLSGCDLSWDEVDASCIKYAVYAIPNGTPVDQINSVTFEGIKSDYLVDVTFAPEFTLPENVRQGYWYAVTVIDGWGNENEPAYINAPSGVAEQVTLISPIGGATAQWSQTFDWSDTEQPATYRLQLARDVNFTQLIVDRAGLTQSSEVVDLSALESGATIYWRVYTTQSECFDKSSAVETFVVPQRQPAPATTLLAPDNGAEFETDFDFACSVVDATQYTVQVATDAEMTNVKFESNEMTLAGDRMTLNFQPGLVGLGRFYWRVLTSSAITTPTASEVRSFVVTNLTTGAFEPGYVIKKDIDTYQPIGTLILENDWVRSTKSPYSNMTFDSDGLMNRGFTVKDDRVLVIGRIAGDPTSNVYIDHYSALTGEHLKRVAVSDNVKCYYYPGNDIFLDRAGNVVITNLVLNISSQPINIFQVDPETGEATLRASLTIDNTETSRIDHCNIFGDVSTGSFTVMAALSNGTQIVRWTVDNGEISSTRVTRAQSFYPSSASHFGLAPRVYPISNTQLYVTGGATFLSRYVISSGRMTDSFANNSALEPEGTNANGAAFFDLAGKGYMLYPYSDYNSATGFRFALAENPVGDSFADYTLKWVFPQQGMGNLNSQTWDAPCAVTDGRDANSKRLFVYVPGNGLAAYTLRLGLRGDVNADGAIDAIDLNILINIVLGNDNADNYQGRADVHADGNIDGSDINDLVNIILGKD